MAAMQIGGHRLAQCGQAIGGRIAMMTIPQRLDACLNDMLRRPKIGLTDAQIDDVATLGGQGLRAGQNDKGRFRAQARQALGEFQVRHARSLYDARPKWPLFFGIPNL